MRWVFLLCLVAQGAWGATWYVRPITAEYGLEDGSSYANAYDGFADITWGPGGVEAGDTLKVCGTFAQTSADTASSNQAMMRVQGSGSSGNLIIIDGDCSGDGDLSTAVIAGSNTSGSVMRSLNNTYITFRNLDLSGAKDACLTLNNDATTETAVARYITVESTVTCHNVHGGSSSMNAIRMSGTNYTIGDYSTTGRKIAIYDIGTDAIFCYSCGNLLVDGANIWDISEDDTDGDCVQLQRNTNGDQVLDVDCDKTNVDSKHCVVLGTLTSQSNVTTIERLDCEMADAGSVSSGVYAEGQTTLRNSRIHNAPNYGVIVGLNNSAKLTATGNIITSPNSGCFSVRRTSAGGAADIYNNTCVAEGVTVAAFDFTANTATINAKNNTITGSGLVGVYRGASGTSDNYNNVYGFTTNYSDNGVAGSASTNDINAAPLFVGGPSPTTANGFRLTCSSPLRNAGTDVGRLTDYGGRLFKIGTPSIGAWEHASGDDRCTVTARTTPAARSTITPRSAITPR